MVIYRTGDGQPGYHQAEELDEAVKFVERLRNGDGVDSARIFRMEEVNFDFRPYFKVEIGPSGEPVQVPMAEAISARPPVAQPEPPAAPEPEPAPAAEVPDPPPAPAAPAASDDAWGDLGAEFESEPTPLVEQAASFMPDAEAEAEAEDPVPVDGNANGHAEEGVGARRGLFGR